MMATNTAAWREPPAEYVFAIRDLSQPLDSCRSHALFTLRPRQFIVDAHTGAPQYRLQPP
jgi:hypothetical protein